MSIPSIIILPPDLSTILNRQFESVDLPAPVRPTIPICNEMIIKCLHCAFCKGLGPLHWHQIHEVSGQRDWILPKRTTLPSMEDVMSLLRISLYPNTHYSLERLRLVCEFSLLLSNLITIWLEHTSSTRKSRSLLNCPETSYSECGQRWLIMGWFSWDFQNEASLPSFPK